MDRTLPRQRARAAARLGAAGAERLRRRAQARRAPRPSPRPASTRRRSSASAPTSPPAPWSRPLADGTPLNELPEFADRPHAYVKLWKHHAAQAQADRINELAARARRGVAAALRRAHLERVGVRQGPAAARGGPRALRRMDHWVEAADWIVWQLSGRYVRNACTAGYKGILQDGEYPSREFLAALNPDFADFAETKVAHEIGQLGDAAGTLTAEAAGLDRPARGHRRRRRQRRRPRHGPRRPGRRARPDGRDHGHAHLPRHERRRCSPRSPACAASSTAASSRGLYGYEAGQSGVGDIFAWYVENQVPRAGTTRREARRHQRPPVPDRPRRRPARRRPRPRRARLAQRQPLGARRPRAVAASIVGQTLATRARGGLPRAARGHRLRHAHDRRDVQRRPACPSPSSSSPAACSRTRSSCRPTATSCACRSRSIAQRAGPRARLRHPRRRRRGRLPRHRASRATRWAASTAPSYMPDEAARRRLRRALRRVPAAARLLRPRRQRRHAPPQGDQPGGAGRARALDREPEAPAAARHDGGHRMTFIDRATETAIDETRRAVCDLHAELVRYGLVVWTGGNVSRPRARRRPVRHQAERRRLRRPDAREP